MKTLALKYIKDKWRDAIANSTAIEEFCLNKYSKELTLFIGIDMKNPPSKQDCPYIIILPGVKKEGYKAKENVYALSLGWAIVNDNYNISTSQSGKVVEFIGNDDADELGQLILEEIAKVNTSSQIAAVDYQIEPADFFPQFLGQMILELEIESPPGFDLVY